jgi:hypothetical protein
MASKLYIKEDITDWRDECLREEVEITSEDDLIDLVVNGKYSTAQVGRWAVTGREMGITPVDIIDPTKALINSAARRAVQVKISNRRIEVELPNGRTYSVRAFVGIPGHKPNTDTDNEKGMAQEKKALVGDAEGTYFQFESIEGVRLALHSLHNVIPGHIFERLKIIAAMNGDVVGTADELKATIDEMVGRLV